MNALVVLEGSLTPFLSGFAAVGFDDGVASLLTMCVWPLCRAGLAHGSSSRFSNESFLKRRDLEGELPEVSGLAGGLEVCCFGDGSSRFSETLDVLICLRYGSDGSGSSIKSPC